MNEETGKDIQLGPGIVVRVRSGGPRMTICATEDDNGYYRCAWFDKAGNYKEHNLHKGALLACDPQIATDPVSGEPIYEVL